MAQEKKERKKISILATSIIGASTLLLGGGVGSLITYFNTRLPLDEQKILQEYRILKNEWLFGNENEYLLDDAAAAILSGTNDPYTFYTKTSQEQNLNTSGYGFGISHRYIGGSTYIREVHDGPSKNKLLAGDIILGAKRNNESYTSFSSFNASQISSFLSDNKFNEYEFSILRGSETINVKVTKGNYSQNTVSLIQSPREENNYVMAVKVSTFLGNPSLHLKTLINNEYERVPKINKLIIDLRENGGGYVKQASQMAKLFVKKNQLIYICVRFNSSAGKININQRTYNRYRNCITLFIFKNNKGQKSQQQNKGMEAGIRAKIIIRQYLMNYNFNKSQHVRQDIRLKPWY